MKRDLSGCFDNSEKGEVFGHCRWMGGVDPVVALHLRNTADYRLPTFGPHGTKLGHSCFEQIIKSDFLAGLTILKKERCLGIVGGWGVDPVVALHLGNAADYRLPTFGPHGTKLGPVVPLRLRNAADYRLITFGPHGTNLGILDISE